MRREVNKRRRCAQVAGGKIPRCAVVRADFGEAAKTLEDGWNTRVVRLANVQTATMDF